MEIANVLQLEAFPRATPVHSRFNYDTIPSLKSLNLYALPYYSVSAADILLYDVIVTFDLWPWTFAAYRLWCDETLYQIWTQSRNPRRNYCDLNIWPNDLERRVTCCARLWDNFHKVWPSTNYPCIAFFMVIRYVMMRSTGQRFDPLTLKVRGTSSITWSKSVHNLNEIEQSAAELLII